MILINRKVDYAILALVHLAKADKGVSARELSEMYGLARPFIANILKDLCRLDFIQSKRGIYGGYSLAKSVDEITVDDVITAMDGSFQLIACSSDEAECNEEQPASTCDLTQICPITGPLRMVHDEIRNVLKNCTLRKLIQSVPCAELLTVKEELTSNGGITDLSGQ